VSARAREIESKRVRKKLSVWARERESEREWKREIV